MNHLFVANWKMNLPALGAQGFAEKINTLSPTGTLVICPAFPYLREVGTALQHAQLGAQTCSEFEMGAHTGQVSAQMLADIGC